MGFRRERGHQVIAKLFMQRSALDRCSATTVGFNREVAAASDTQHGSTL
jgi:hypothetical protein